MPHLLKHIWLSVSFREYRQVIVLEAGVVDHIIAGVGFPRVGSLKEMKMSIYSEYNCIKILHITDGAAWFYISLELSPGKAGRIFKLFNLILIIKKIMT